MHARGTVGCTYVPVRMSVGEVHRSRVSRGRPGPNVTQVDRLPEGTGRTDEGGPTGSVLDEGNIP